MQLSDLFTAIDARPFRPFKIEFVSGRQIDVVHPENIHVGPSRQRVVSIVVYQSDPYDMAIIWPEGLAAILFPEQPTTPA